MSRQVFYTDGTPSREIEDDSDKVTPLVSDDEVTAAKRKLDELAAIAGREQPVPDTLVRIVLEEAAMVRTGMLPKPGQKR